MNGHTHHVGGHHSQLQNQSFNNLNLKQLYNQPHAPYQSVGYVPTNNVYQQQNYNSMYHGQFGHGQQGSMAQIGQNLGLGQQSSTQFGHMHQQHHQQNNNFGSLNIMSNQQNLNPSNMTLGGYHNQGYGSHNNTQESQKPVQKK
jgi:hypothetical protein